MKTRDVLHKTDLAVMLRDCVWETYVQLIKKQKLTEEQLDDEKGKLLTKIKKKVNELTSSYK